MFVLSTLEGLPRAVPKMADLSSSLPADYAPRSHYKRITAPTGY